MTEITIRPRPGRLVPLPVGGTALDGLAIPPGTRLPEEGAHVELGSYIRRRLDDEDAEMFDPEAPEASPEAQTTGDAR